MLPLLDAATGQSALHWHLLPDAIFLCVALLGAYFYAVTRLRDEIADAGRVKRLQVVSYSAGVAVIYLASSSPIHELAENYLASAHMFQHLLYTLVAPPLLIAGVPSWLWRGLLTNRAVFRFARVATLPLVAFAVFNAVQLLTHLPSAVDLALTVHWFHLLVHITLISTAMLMWWPILSPLPELPRLSYPLQMAYLFVQSLLPSVLAAFITFSNGVFYKYYATAPRIWGLTPIEDQQFAGFIMKIVGSVILWGFIGWAFFKWYERETADDREPRWDAVRDEMSRMGLPLDRR